MGLVTQLWFTAARCCPRLYSAPGSFARVARSLRSPRGCAGRGSLRVNACWLRSLLGRTGCRLVVRPPTCPDSAAHTRALHAHAPTYRCHCSHRTYRDITCGSFHHTPHRFVWFGWCCAHAHTCGHTHGTTFTRFILPSPTDFIRTSWDVVPRTLPDCVPPTPQVYHLFMLPTCHTHLPLPYLVTLLWGGSHVAWAPASSVPHTGTYACLPTTFYLLYARAAPYFHATPTAHDCLPARAAHCTGSLPVRALRFTCARVGSRFVPPTAATRAAVAFTRCRINRKNTLLLPNAARSCNTRTRVTTPHTRSWITLPGLFTWDRFCSRLPLV